MTLVTRDATSGRWVPASAAEYTSLLSGTGISNPAFLWLCQEAAGNLADSIGACTLTAANSPSYQSAVTGWSRKAVSWADGSTSRFDNTATPPNGNASSLTLFGYFYVSSMPGADRFMASMTDFAIHLVVDSGGHEKIYDNATTAGATVISDGVVRPFLIVYNRAASTCKLYTPTETVDGGYASSAGVHTILGAYPSLATPAGGCLYAAQFTGAAAELTATQAATLLDRFQNGPAVTSIAVTPAPVALGSLGATQQLTATATRADGSTSDVTATATWSSDAPGVATVSATGLVTAVSAGVANISCTYTSLNASTATSNNSVVTVAGALPVPTGGLLPDGSVLELLRFDEALATVPPSDAMNALADLQPVHNAVPNTAIAMAAAVGYGTWSAGYLCDDAGPNLAAAFGAPAMTPLSTPLYQLPGPFGDFAIGFDSVNDGFSAGNNFNTGTGDVCFAWVARLTAAPANCDVMVKYAGAQQYQLRLIAGAYRVDLDDGAGHTLNLAIGTAAPIGPWHVGIFVIDRANGTARIAISTLDATITQISAASSVAAIGSLTSTANWIIGSATSTGFGTGAPTALVMAGFWIGAGAGVAANMSANLAQAVENLRAWVAGTVPAVTTAFCGFGRALTAGRAFQAKDLIPGTTLATRDVTIQAILSWDMTAQSTLGTDGTIIARGNGGSAAEYVCYALQLHIVNLALQIGEVSLWWQDTGGGVHVEPGGQFVLPPAGSFMMLTAVRHWIDATHVEVRYYAGDQLLAESTSSDGSIGGGTTGTTTVGARYSGTAPGNFLCGVIDEIRVLNYEVTAEEIAATFARLSVLQPRAYSAIRQLVQPGAPISGDPSSRIQKLLRLAGHMLGYAAAQAENMRLNTLPDRAYGATLAQHERILQESPASRDSVATRRKRLLAHLRQRSGVSIPGVAATVADLLAIGKTQLQVIAFDNTIRDDFSQGLRSTLWMADDPTKWAVTSGALHVTGANAASLPYDSRGWYTCLAAALGSRVSADGRPTAANDTTNYFNGRGGHILAKMSPTTLGVNGEAGVVFYDFAKNNVLMFGLRNNAGVYQLVTETIVNGVSTGVTVIATSALVTHWLHLYQPASSGSGFFSLGNAPYQAAFSTTGPLSGYTTTASFTHRASFDWMGFYLRTFGGGALAAATDVAFDDVIMRHQYGSRPFRFYVYRDPTLPGSPDLTGAELALQRLQQAHTSGHVITTKVALCDVAGTADRTPTGGF